MKEIEVKKRSWAWKAATVFFAVLLVLTFFSNTILNRSLPEVAAQYTQGGTISSKIRGSGSVSANELFEVLTTQSYTVSEVRVRLGDLVEVGDVLLTISRDSSMELEEKEEALRTAEYELERFLIDSPDSSYASYYRSIQRAKNGLDDAKESRSSAERKLKAARDERAAISYDAAAYRSAEARVNAATAERDKKAADYEIANRNLQTYLDIRYPGSMDAEGDAMVDEDSSKPGDWPNTVTAPSPQDSYWYLKWAANMASRSFTDAQNKLDKERVDTNFAALSAAKERWDVADSAVAMAAESYNSADSMVASAQISLDEANDALAEAQRAGGKTNTLFDMEVKEKERRIEELRDEVDELVREGSLSEITAKVSGRIASVNISAGHQTIPDSPLMVIEVVDMGYSLSIPVTSMQASKVNIGEVAEVDRGWWSWGNPLSAVLTGIRPDPQNPAGGRLLVFSVSGDELESGTQLNITITQRSENYSTVVPNSAIRSDTNGDFVLLVETKSSPLRNRYIATRVDVTILASDDTHSAISGAGLGGWDFVITTSTRPIEPGMQVRLVDNP